MCSGEDYTSVPREQLSPISAEILQDILVHSLSYRGKAFALDRNGRIASFKLLR